MTTIGPVPHPPAHRLRHPFHRAENPAGVLSTVLGLVGFAALVWAWLLTTIDPPNWVRVPGLVLLPIGSLGSLGVGVIGMLAPPRRWAAVGLTLGALTLLGLLLLQLRYG
jgi:hypothetical protein